MKKEEEQTRKAEKEFREMSNLEKDEFLVRYGFDPFLYKLMFIEKEKVKVGDFTYFYPPEGVDSKEPLGFGEIVKMSDTHLFIKSKLFPDVLVRVKKGDTLSKHLIIRLPA